MKPKLEKLIQLLEEKASVKQDVFAHSKLVFTELKAQASVLIDQLSARYKNRDERVKINFKDVSPYEFRVRIGGDILVFHMHSNVFQYPENHHFWHHSYFKEDPARSYGGIINVYNFLADSLQYNRENDLGFLIARLFINRDNNFALEGDGQLNTCYRHIEKQVFNSEVQARILELLFEFALEFELYIPQYKRFQTVSVKQAQDFKKRIKIKTSKRLGFEFGGHSLT